MYLEDGSYWSLPGSSGGYYPSYYILELGYTIMHGVFQRDITLENKYNYLSLDGPNNQYKL